MRRSNEATSLKACIKITKALSSLENFGMCKKVACISTRTGVSDIRPMGQIRPAKGFHPARMYATEGNKKTMFKQSNFI